MPEYRLLAADRLEPWERRARIFRLATPQIDREAVFALARRAGLSADPRVGRLHEDARKTTYAEGSFEVVLHHASGGVRFHDTARWQVDDGSADVRLGDGAATELARRHIERLAVVPLDECMLLQVTRLKVGVAERRSGGFFETRVIDVGVAFQRIIDGLPVVGPGGKVVVYLDGDGSLTGFDRLWREIGDIARSDVELRSPNAAQEDVRRYWGDGGAGVMTIDDVRFGYYEGGWDDAQQFLQPAYVLPLSLVADKGDATGHVVMRSEHLVAAAVDSPEPLMLVPPDAAPQPRRGDQGLASVD